MCGVTNGRLILKSVTACLTNLTEYLAELALLVLLVGKNRKQHSLKTSAGHWEFTGFVAQNKMDYRLNVTTFTKHTVASENL